MAEPEETPKEPAAEAEAQPLEEIKTEEPGKKPLSKNTIIILAVVGLIVLLLFLF